ncbi:hypothetical protein BLNAU_11598 [Blattamonas nauphoetae]|uniref:Uncharacterized protein n=1 Tax=Blattamonas nauphoetae TaxID=2049346 RepID=A0ABQ9XNY9_9EUKA|nr:hypothetical protein BLNAU_11598 [Blattamonas nauphoetae]
MSTKKPNSNRFQDMENEINLDQPLTFQRSDGIHLRTRRRRDIPIETISPNFTPHETQVFHAQTQTSTVATIQQYLEIVQKNDPSNLVTCLTGLADLSSSQNFAETFVALNGTETICSILSKPLTLPNICSASSNADVCITIVNSGLGPKLIEWIQSDNPEIVDYA